MKTTIENKLRGFLLEVMVKEDEADICDIASPKTEKELHKLIDDTDHITPEQRKEVNQELKDLESTNDYLSNDMDNTSTVAHKISTTLCSKLNPKNLDENYNTK